MTKDTTKPGVVTVRPGIDVHGGDLYFPASQGTARPHQWEMSVPLERLKHLAIAQDPATAIYGWAAIYTELAHGAALNHACLSPEALMFLSRTAQAVLELARDGDLEPREKVARLARTMGFTDGEGANAFAIFEEDGLQHYAEHLRIQAQAAGAPPAASLAIAAARIGKAVHVGGVEKRTAERRLKRARKTGARPLQTTT